MGEDRGPERRSGMNPAEAAETAARARSGDAEAWGALYRAYAPAVFRLCRRALPTREDAEDATAEIFMKLRLKLDRYDSGRPFPAWLYKLAANHCWDELRRRRTRQGLETNELGMLEEPDASQLERLLEQSTQHAVRSALARLPDRPRMALVMRYYAGLSYQEMAQVLGVEENFVGVLLLRARRQLRRLIEGVVGS